MSIAILIIASFFAGQFFAVLVMALLGANKIGTKFGPIDRGLSDGHGPNEPTFNLPIQAGRVSDQHIEHDQAAELRRAFEGRN